MSREQVDPSTATKEPLKGVDKEGRILDESALQTAVSDSKRPVNGARSAVPGTMQYMCASCEEKIEIKYNQFLMCTECGFWALYKLKANRYDMPKHASFSYLETVLTRA